MRTLAACLVAGALGCGGSAKQTLVEIDVVADRDLSGVTLRLTAGSSSRSFSGVSVGPTTVYKAGLFLPGNMGGDIEISGEVSNAMCVVGEGMTTARGVIAGARNPPVSLQIAVFTGCRPSADASADAADARGTGGSGTGGAGTGGTGTGGAGTGGAGTGGAGTGGAGTGGAGTGGRGTGGAGTGGAGTGGRGTGGTGTGGAGTGGAGTGGAGTGGRGTGGAGTGGAGTGGAGTGGAGTGGAGTGGAGTGGAGGRHAFMYGPAVTSRGLGSLDVFAVGDAGGIYQRSFAAGGWTSWSRISGGGILQADIDATSWDASRIDLFGIGTTNEVYQSAFAGTWSDWYNLSPGTAFTLGTGASAPAVNRMWVFATGTDSAMWSRFWNGAAWSPWASAGGVLTSAPDAVSRPAVTWAVVRGQPYQIWIARNTSNTPGAWSLFSQLPALAGGAGFSFGPCITAWTDLRVDVFAVGGINDSLWHNYSTDGGTTWAAPNWEDWGGGPLASTPDCVAWASGRLDIVALRPDGHVWHLGWETTPTTWEDLGVF